MINIISREVVGDFSLYPPVVWYFHISQSDWDIIVANHELLQIQTAYAGWVKPWIAGGDPNASIYGADTSDPFEVAWYTNYSTASIPSGDWSISFIQEYGNPFFTDLIDWTAFTTGTITPVVPPVTPPSTIEPILLEWTGASDLDGTIERYELSYRTTGSSFINIASISPPDPNDRSHGSYSYTPIQQITHTFRIVAVDDLGAASVPKYYQHQIVVNYQISNTSDTQTLIGACQLTQVATYSSVFLSTTPIAVGVTVFMDAAKTIRKAGHNYYWIIKTPSGLQYSCRIDGYPINNGLIGGEIIELYLCSGGGGTGDNSGLITLGRSSIQGINGVCQLGWQPGSKYWQNTLEINTIIYNDSAHTSFFNGYLKYYIIQYTNELDLTIEKVVIINNFGAITYINNRSSACSVIRSAQRSVGGVSGPVDGTCTLSTTQCYIRTTDASIINTGDIVYTDINGTIPFNGSDSYYRLYLSLSAATDLTNAIGKVGFTGIVTISGYCGSSIGGAGCPVPETLILLANGKQIPAGDVKVGDMVYTLHEITFELGEYEVKEAEILYQDRLQITFEDESIIKVSDTHKFLMIDKSWKSSYKLVNGDIIKGLDIDKMIISIEKIGIGEVVKFNIIDAHTYISAGLISHNLKSYDDYNIYIPNFGN